MSHAHEDLGHRLTALRSEFTALGTRAAGAAASLAATLPPPAALLDELTAAREAFTGLRSSVVEQAATLSIVLDAENLGSLRDIEPVLAAIEAAEAQRARRAAWESARDQALGVLDQVTALAPREDRGVPALAECQDRARELRAALTGPPPDDLEGAGAGLPDRVRPYTELLALVDGWNTLDDDRCAALQDAITASFGRGLALAALRGRIARPGQTAPPAGRGRSRAPARAPVQPVAPTVAATPVAPPVEPAPTTPLETLLPPVPAAPPPPVVEVPPAVATVAAPEAVDESADLENPGITGAEADTAARRSEQEGRLERLAQESARWWLAARAGWQTMRDRGLTFGDAAHDYLARFPHLLSVPLTRSAEHADGRLAEGYALLLAHIDKQEPGFVPEALLRLNPQFGARGPDEAYPLGQELYLYVVAEARLYKTYPDFVREVIQHAIPAPGAWVQGGIVDGDDETRLFMRAEAPGSTEEQTRTLTDPKERLGPHLFRVSLGPLTTRFFTLRLAGETLSDPPNVEIKLRENDAPTDHAWLVTLPAPGKTLPAPRKHRTGGTTLEELGKQFSGFWMGVFNADPNHDRDYELSVILRRKPPPVSGGAKPAPDRFFGRKR